MYFYLKLIKNNLKNYITQGEISYIRVKEGHSSNGADSPYPSRGGRSRSRSYSPVTRRRGSPTYSPVRRSYSRSRS